MLGGEAMHIAIGTRFPGGRSTIEIDGNVLRGESKKKGVAEWDKRNCFFVFDSNKRGSKEFF